MIVLMTEVLPIKAHAHDNHRLLSYYDNGFCNMIITLSILLHITKAIAVNLICFHTTLGN